MDLRERKPNRIPGYDYGQNGVYFLTICTQDRKHTLSRIVGDGFPVPKPIGTIAENLIRQLHDRYPSVSVDNYVIMPDHIHILLHISSEFGTGNPSPTLGTIVGWYKYQLTRQANLLAGTQGQRILQRSYYDHVIRNQHDYNEIWDYITNNPRKWIIQKRGYE